MNKTFKADIHAYAIDGNWLCPCGRYIKDSLHIHRLIRQGDRVPTDKKGRRFWPRITGIYCALLDERWREDKDDESI